MKTLGPLSIAFVLSLPAVLTPRAFTGERVEVRSPNGEVRIEFSTTNDHLTFSVDRAGRPVIEPSPLGMFVDGTELGRGVELRATETHRFDERFPTRGVHS